MSSEFILTYFLPFIAFAMGACIGSFLNVVIYRVPLGMGVGNPKRSFCPNCKTQIPAWLNIPLVTWLMLGGKCKWCKSEIKFRYFLVELLTAIVFLAIWKLFFVSLGIGGVIALWILSALLIAATFIDIDHMIIPDSITLGGLGVGLLASVIVPAIQQEKTWQGGLLAGLIGAALGYCLLWGVVLLGKMMFGLIKHEFAEAVDFEISQPGGEDEAIIIQLGPEQKYEWQDVFYRASDRMEMDVTEVRFNDVAQEVRESFKIVGDGFVIDGVKTPLDGVKKVTGKCTRAVVPREAMGYGDVKFIAMIGAFLGWKAVLITIMSACCFGAIIGLIQKWLSKDSKIPFGPYLALGAFIFIFTGVAIWNWYAAFWHGAFR